MDSNSMTATATAMDTPQSKRLPAPLAKFGTPRWFFNKAIELGESFPASHIVLLAWVAVYYILFQSIPAVKDYWDTLFSQHIHLLSQAHWDTWRHFFRNGGEAYLVTMTVLFLTFNPYKQKKIDKLNSAGEVIGRVALTLLAAIPVMIVVGLLLHHVQGWFHTGTLSPAVGSHPNLAQKLYSDQWTTKVSVVVAGLVCRRLMYPVFAFVQEYFAERRVAKGKKDRLWHPAPIRARIRELRKAGATTSAAIGNMQSRQAKRGNAVVWLMSGGAVVTVLLAIYGGYILEHFAK